MVLRWGVRRTTPVTHRIWFGPPAWPQRHSPPSASPSYWRAPPPPFRGSAPSRPAGGQIAAPRIVQFASRSCSASVRIADRLGAAGLLLASVPGGQCALRAACPRMLRARQPGCLTIREPDADVGIVDEQREHHRRYGRRSRTEADPRLITPHGFHPRARHALAASFEPDVGRCSASVQTSGAQRGPRLAEAHIAQSSVVRPWSLGQPKMSEKRGGVRRGEG